MAQYTYEEAVSYTLTAQQRTALGTFLSSVTNLPLSSLTEVTITRGTAPSQVFMTVRGQRVKNCTTQAEAEALLDDVLAGKLLRVTLKE